MITVAVVFTNKRNETEQYTRVKVKFMPKSEVKKKKNE